LSNTDAGNERREPADRRSSYVQLVVRQFCKHRMAVVGWWMVILLFTIAVFAPFLANNKPLVMRRGGVWSFPLLRTLDLRDLALLGAFWAFAINSMLKRLVLRGRGPLYRRARVFVWGLAVALVGASGLHRALAGPSTSDARDYKPLVAQLAPPDFALMPPIPYHYLEIDMRAEFGAPSAPGHLLGVDDTGRDVAARLIHGSRVSLAVGFISVGISTIIGLVVGALAGYFGGWVDLIIMRLIEVVICFPTLFLMLTILAFLPRSIFVIMAVIGITGWTGTARLVRAEFFRQKGLDYAVAGRALGLSNVRLMFRHILPNAVTPVLVTATFGIAGAILSETSLTFLGLGVGPETPSWGEMLAEGNANPALMWHLVLLPGLAIFVNVLAYNLVGDGLRDAIDPRLRI